MSGTLPPTQPPATPWVVYATPNASTPANWDLVRSQGTSIGTNIAQSAVLSTVKAFMVTASADLSTLLTILSPSGNVFVSGQLNSF
jgi:hypothetical protein